MRFSFLLFISLLLLQSCLQENGRTWRVLSTLKDCDEVTIVYYEGYDTLTCNALDSTEISILTELISRRNERVEDNCKPAGRLFYKSRGKILLNGEFSTPDANETGNCIYVSYGSGDKYYKHRLTYRAGRLIDEALWRIKGSTLIINIDSSILK